MSFTTRRIREESDSASRKIHLPGRTILASLPLLFRFLKFRREKSLEEDTQNRRTAILKRIALILLAVLVALGLLAGVVKALVSLRILSLGSFLNAASTDLPTDDDGFTNFLLLGQGDETHDGVDLTDTLMVASLDPGRTKSAVLLSVPRDLYMIKTEKMGVGRINSLYRDYKNYLIRGGMEEDEASQEAMKELSREVGRMLNMEIHHIAKVDFIGFVQGVDALGGIDIDVPYDIVDTQYPGPNYSYETFEIRAGPAHLDGETALKYARSRHTTSDFGRSARQQQILKALASKAKEMGILGSTTKLTTLMKILTEHTETSMSFSEILGAAKLAKAIDTSRIITMQLSLDGAGGFLYPPPREDFEGASVLLPVSIPPSPITWKQLHTLTLLLLRNRAIYVSNPELVVLNAGAQSSLATILGNELIRYGFDVSTVDNAPLEGKQSQSWVSPRLPEDENMANFFATLLHLDIRPLPPEIPIGEAGQVTIFLGEDYRYEPLQNLLQ